MLPYGASRRHAILIFGTNFSGCAKKSLRPAHANAPATLSTNILVATLNCGGILWAEMRNLGLLPKTNGLHGFSPDDLNNHFASVSCSATENLLDAMTVLENSSTDGFAFSRVNYNDVVLAVSHFSWQARGEDGIPQSVITVAIPSFGPLLVQIFNSSLLISTFPEAWRKGQLIPLKKKSVPSSPTDFRPIALLSFLSKLLEKLV